MKCCVPFCGATSDNYPCTVDETNFHEFPTIPSLRKSWLAKIGIKESYLPQCAVVCSQHFARDDFYWAGTSGTGKRKFKKTAIPSILPVSNSEAPTFEFCLICLDPGASKLFPLDSNHLARAYTTLTGLAINVLRDHIKTVPKLCPECAQRLSKCDAFKDKTMRAHFILIKLLQKHKTVTAQSLKSVDRVRNVLTSNIVKRTFTPNHCDLYLVHNEEDDNKVTKQEKHMIYELEENIDGNSVKSDETVYESDKDANDFEIHSEEDDHKHTKQEENFIYELEDNIYGKNAKSDESKYECDKDADDYEIHSEEDNNEHTKQDEKIIYTLEDNIDGKSEKSDVSIHESDKDANDYVVEYLSELEDDCGKVQGINTIKKKNAGRTNYGEQNKNESDDDIIHPEKKFNYDYNKINPVVYCDSDDEVEFLDVDSDHSLKCEGDDEMDFDIDICNHIDNYLNENCRGDILLNALKVGTQSDNRVSLNNVIFVKDPKPIIQHKDAIPKTDNNHPNQNISKINDTKGKSKTNKLAINKVLKQRKENAKPNNNNLTVKHNKKNTIMNEKKLNMILKNNINKPSVSINIANGKIVIKPTKKTNPKNENKVMSDTQLMKTKFLIVNSPKRQVAETETVPGTKKSTRARQLPADKYIPRPKTQNCRKMGLKSFTRTWLTHEEQLSEMQKRRDSNEYRSSAYKCEMCYKVFCTTAIHKAHMDKHTDKYGKLVCDVCDLHFKTRPFLTRHLLLHGNIYNCILCSFNTHSRTIAMNHQRFHDGKTYKCRLCDAEFRKPTSYCSHMRIKHPSDYACALCGYSFVSPAGVKVHIKLKHPFDDVKELSGPSCEPCDVRFASEAAYQQHLQVSPKHAVFGDLKRNEPRPKRTFLYDRAKAHAWYAARRARDDELRKKNRAKPRDKILCELCGKGFYAAISLKEHMCKHTGERRYKCEICDKQFIYNVSYKAHVLRHSDKTRYTCGVCQKTFSSVSNRTKHMRSHLTSRPMYQCKLCDKSYTEPAGLDQHMSHVHLKVPWPKRDRRDRYRPKAKRPRLESDSRDTGEEQP